MAVICIGDGRLVELEEGALRVPPPAPPKPKKPRVSRIPKRVRKPRSVMIRGHKAKFDFRNLPKSDGAALKAWTASLTPDYLAWRARRNQQITRLSAKGRPRGAVDGMTLAQSNARWADARRKAKRDVKLMTDKLDLGAAAQEAMLETLTIMRGPGDSRQKLAAAKLVLEYSMAKPASKSEVTVNSAEKFLESLADDTGG